MIKKVAIFAHASAMEGAERSLIATLQSLKNSGWEILVVVRQEGPFTERLQELTIPFKKLRYSWWETVESQVEPKWARLNYLSAYEASILVRNFGASLVYTNTSVIAVGAVASALADIPHIFHIRELATGSIFEKHINALPAIGKFIGNASNYLIFNSRSTRESWAPFLPKGTLSQIIYNPLTKPNIEATSEPMHGLNISVIGSITPLKSQLDVLKATKFLLDKGVKITTHIIGPVRNDAYKKELDSFIFNEKMEENVRFVGYIDNPYILASGCQLVIVPGNLEGFGRVTAESMLAGIPVLAASGGATNELIQDGKTGFLFEKGNIAQLAEKIEHLISNPESLTSVVKNGQLHIESLTNSEKSASALLDLFEKSLREKNTLSPWMQMINPFGTTDEILPLIKADKLISTLKSRVFKRKS